MDADREPSLATLLAALVLCQGSYYFFVVPPHLASCPAGCTGWRGFPLPVAQIALDGTFPQVLLAEAEGQRIAGASADAMEGGMAFLQKRAPIFRGE